MPHIVTNSGARIAVTSGLPTIRDIALNHCRTPMFGGHTNLPYSVAHHCLAAAHLAELTSGRVDVPYFTLLHETEVAVYGDIPGPVKIIEQRRIENSFRGRYFAAKCTPLPNGVWDQVEFFDKIEQAACVTWAGLPEPVHEKLWNATDAKMQALAIRVTKNLWGRYNPIAQLHVGSDLFNCFVETHERYYRAYRDQLEKAKGDLIHDQEVQVPAATAVEGRGNEAGALPGTHC